MAIRGFLSRKGQHYAIIWRANTPEGVAMNGQTLDAPSDDVAIWKVREQFQKKAEAVFWILFSPGNKEITAERCAQFAKWSGKFSKIGSDAHVLNALNELRKTGRPVTRMLRPVQLKVTQKMESPLKSRAAGESGVSIPTNFEIVRAQGQKGERYYLVANLDTGSIISRHQTINKIAKALVLRNQSDPTPDQERAVQACVERFETKINKVLANNSVEPLEGVVALRLDGFTNESNVHRKAKQVVEACQVYSRFQR